MPSYVRKHSVALQPKSCYCEVVGKAGTESFKIIALLTQGILLEADRPSLSEAYQAGQDVLLNIQLSDKGLESGAFPCCVESVVQQELFLVFPCSLSISTLQTLGKAE